jgi:6,7-dimethyl-8-ribityllumazine synthase
VALAVSRFNEVVTSSLLSGAVSRIVASGVNEKEFTVVHVRGF